MELVHRALKAKCSAIDLDTLVARLIDEIIMDCRYVRLRPPRVFLRLLWRERLFGLDGGPGSEECHPLARAPREGGGAKARS